jgi:hypothetical protein
MRQVVVKWDKYGISEGVFEKFINELTGEFNIFVWQDDQGGFVIMGNGVFGYARKDGIVAHKFMRSTIQWIMDNCGTENLPRAIVKDIMDAVYGKKIDCRELKEYLEKNTYEVELVAVFDVDNPDTNMRLAVLISSYLGKPLTFGSL